MMSKKNNYIYKNALRYNDYLKEGKHEDIINIKNDLMFNQKIEEIKQKEEKEKMIQAMNNMKLQKEKNDMQNMLEKELKEQKLLDQLNYRDFLDKQKNEHKNNNNVLISSGEQLLMPSYRYSNIPKSLINYTLNKNYSSLNSYKNEEAMNKFYLGDSTLRHNPITCPMEDLTPKKYIIGEIFRQNQNNKNISMNGDNKLHYLSADCGHNILNDKK